MTHFLPRLPALILLAATGLALALSPGAAAQTAVPADPPAREASPAAADTSPVPADEKLAAQLVDANARGRRLAPHDTFFLLTYVAVRTDKGVDGFAPGQEVHLVEVHRDTQTLVVSDGHAQVEVPPADLTNDLDIAATARQRDEAGQARIAAHRQAEQAAYARYEREAADATARDLAQRQQAQQARAAEERAQEQAAVAQNAPSANASFGGDGSSYNGFNGYYDLGGYGYGSPYSYLSGPTVVVRPNAPAAVRIPAVPGAVAAPGGRPGGGRPK